MPKSARIRVVRLIPVLDYGGVESVFLTQAKHIDRDVFEYRVCTFWKRGEIARAIEHVGIQVDVLNVDPSIRNPRATLALLRYLRFVRPDIVHSAIGEANFHCALTAKLAGVPVVILEEAGLPSRALFSRLAHAGMYRATDAVVGVSKASCAYVRDREFAPVGRVRLLYNAIDGRFFDTPLPARTPRDEFRFITVGRLAEVKNQEMLIRAFAAIASDVPHATLWLVGDGALRSRLEGVRDELRLGERVLFAGYQRDVLPLLDEADFFLLPSLSEGFGVAAVEAMARGLPALISSAGALPELITGVLGHWVLDPANVSEWSNEMRRVALLGHQELAQARDAFRGAAEAFSPGVHVAELQALYLGLRDKPGFVMGTGSVRNIIRDVVDAHAPGTGQALRSVRRWVYDTAEQIQYQNRSRRDVFTSIYESNRWGDQASASGTGSNLDQTSVLRGEIPKLLAQLQASSLLDAPCGDFHWMRHVELGNIAYTGADIVEPLIGQLTARFGGPMRQFIVADLAHDPLPKCDVVFCRDCLVHLSFDDALSVLRNFRASGGTWLVTTTFSEHQRNRDITTGTWRKLNLCKPPFSFPVPYRLLRENCTEGKGAAKDKSLGIWKLAEIGV